TSAMSPSFGSGVPLGQNVRTIPAPDANFTAHIQAAIADLQRHGIQPAALIVDTIFSSDGVYADPPGFLRTAVKAIRAAGGLFIADEVQPGFARTGSHFWGFQRHDVIPDMVSLGKPMGNGYPVAGLVMKPEIIAKFGAKSRYFNTFGGNAVAAATAMAVLDVIEGEHLQANSQTVGAYFRDGLLALAKTYESLGPLRSAGLFLGQDIVTNGQPDGLKAAHITNALRDRRILISATGPFGHTLKIRPPLVFATSNADIFLEGLEKVLKTL
ncbi:MAG: aminotransferase class III-fold pyridoxal phosphate-dependent enzyme, partial [Paracoccaceae bacterium]